MHWITRLAGITVLAIVSSLASATGVSYVLSHVSGPTWEFDVTVNNNTLGVPIHAFDIFFDFATYSNLTAVGQPTDFLPAVQQPVNSPPFFTADGAVTFFDATFASPPGSAAGIGVGATLASFMIQADFSGSAVPGPPTWDVIDANFNTIDQGTASGGSSVPEPGMLGLLSVGLAATAFRRRRSR